MKSSFRGFDYDLARFVVVQTAKRIKIVGQVLGSIGILFIVLGLYLFCGPDRQKCRDFCPPYNGLYANNCVNDVSGPCWHIFRRGIALMVAGGK